MIERYASWIYRRRWIVIVATALSVVGLVPAFIELSGRVGFELFVDRSSDAWRGEELLKKRFGQGGPNRVVLAADPAAAGRARADQRAVLLGRWARGPAYATAIAIGR